ncbi:MAG TPA: ATP-binding protein [Candidatus Woesearchaeota archaeon]|nr:ATP-binding protein [Candidatus Woesearchaeota archaeon]
MNKKTNTNIINKININNTDKIKHKLLVMSAKGGVGKTTIAVNLAYALSRKGFRTGLLDADIHGPNAPKMLGLKDEKLFVRNNKIVPINIKDNNISGVLKVVSMAFLAGKEKAVIWRGPLKHKLIKQFVEDVAWGELDYQVVDLPPGTGDESISISQLLNNITGSIIVSTPQQVALLDVIKSINFSREMNVPIIGMIENMAGDLFGRGGVKILAHKEHINFLGSLELDKRITQFGDKGKPFIINNTWDVSESFNRIVDRIIQSTKKS